MCTVDVAFVVESGGEGNLLSDVGRHELKFAKVHVDANQMITPSR